MTECPVCKCYDCDEIEHHSLVVELRAEVEALKQERWSVVATRNEALNKVTVEGPVQTGKSSVLQSIKGMLESFNHCAVIPEREERNNPSNCISSSEFHERPNQDKTVFILVELCTKPK